MAGRRSFPSRIVCLTEETTETLYLLGEGDRVVGISGYTVRPPEARQKPKVSSFLHARFEKIEALAPDLVLAFSDLQADITTELVKRGYPVFTFNQRSVAEILQMIRVLGGIVGVPEKAAALAARARSAASTRSAHRRRGSRGARASTSRSGTTRSSAASAGSRSWSRSPAARRSSPSCAMPRSAKDRIVTRRARDRRRARGVHRLVVRQAGAEGEGAGARRLGRRCRSSRDGRIFEVKSTYILQPGPAALTEGVRQVHARAVPRARASTVPARASGRRERWDDGVAATGPAARSARPPPS